MLTFIEVIQFRCEWLTNSDLSALRLLSEESSQILSGVGSLAIWRRRIVNDMSKSDTEFQL